MSRVLIADAHAGTRVGLRGALADGGLEVVGEAAAREEAVALAARTHPDLCLVDTDLPGGGVATAEAVCAAVRDTHVVMLSATARPEDLLAALRAGAVGFLAKSMEPASLPRALRAVLDGQAAIPRDLVGLLVAELRDLSGHRRRQFAQRHGVELTAREWEVAELLRERRTTAEMAARLGISAVTARRHVGAVLHKLGAEDRAAGQRLLGEPEPEQARRTRP